MKDLSFIQKKPLASMVSIRTSNRFFPSVPHPFRTAILQSRIYRSPTTSTKKQRTTPPLMSNPTPPTPAHTDTDSPRTPPTNQTCPSTAALHQDDESNSTTASLPTMILFTDSKPFKTTIYPLTKQNHRIIPIPIHVPQPTTYHGN